MKKIKAILYLLLGLLLTLAVTMAMGQTATTTGNDKIIFLNGVIKEGRVTAFANDKIKFTHCDETLDYEFNKKEIEKIEFASGRIEMITARETVLPVVRINTKNRVAVMPVVYAGDGNTDRSGYMRSYLQQMISDFMGKSAAELKFVDITEVNAQLLKKGITAENVQQYSPAELASILQVEYVITGTVLQTVKKQITQTNRRDEGKQTVEKNADNKVKLTEKNNSHKTEISLLDIETEVGLAIYNGSGERIYSKSRQSILSDPDAYKNAIKYLLKRTPLYNR